MTASPGMTRLINKLHGVYTGCLPLWASIPVVTVLVLFAVLAWGFAVLYVAHWLWG